MSAQPERAEDKRTPLLPAPKYKVHQKQREALENDARYKVLEWGRRGGKNIYAVIEFIEHARAPWETQWGSDDPQQTLLWWVARSYDQAKKYGFDKFTSAIPDAWIEYRKRTAPYEVKLTNGVHVEFRTYDHPETLQGAGVDRHIIDEADYMKDSLWYDDLEPMLMDTMGAATFISKPVRPRSYFQKLGDRGKSSDWPDHFYSHSTSADNPFIAEDPEDKRGTMPDAKFRQQYLAELPDDGGQVFKHLGSRLFTGTYELKGDVSGTRGEPTGEAWRPVAQCEPPFVTAVDFARSQDYRVAGALDSNGELCYFERRQNEAWDGIEEKLLRLANDYPGIMALDASRDNKIVADVASQGVKVEPITWSPKTKKSLIEDLITRIEGWELVAPDDDKLDVLWLELSQMERDVTPAGYTRYNAPDDGHDDTVDMLAMAASQLDRIASVRRQRESKGRREESDNGVSGI